MGMGAKPERGTWLDLEAKLDEIAALVERARAMPMSASCVVNRGELLTLLDELRRLLPDQLGEAAAVLRDREAVVEEGRQRAEQLVAEGERDRALLVGATAVQAEAQEEAARLIFHARAEAEQRRREVDEYVDAKLAHFEVMLQKTMATVARGRDRLREEVATLSEIRLPEAHAPEVRPPESRRPQAR